MSKEEGSPRTRRWWDSQIAHQAIGNALGTLIAALVLFIGGVVLGAIDDIPLDALAAAVLGLASSVLGLRLIATREWGGGGPLPTTEELAAVLEELGPDRVTELMEEIERSSRRRRSR